LVARDKFIYRFKISELGYDFASFLKNISKSSLKRDFTFGFGFLT